MCYDVKTSVIALMTNIISCILLFYYANNNQLKVLSLFFLFVGVMQFWDIIFWTYKPDTIINKVSTKLAMIWNQLFFSFSFVQ